MLFFSSVIVLASIYSLLGAGFVTVYRASRILNFAHAEVVMLAGYFAVSCLGIIPNIILSFFIVISLSFILGLVVYFLLIRPLAGYSVLSAIILTVAMGMIINSIAIIGWRGRMEIIPFPWHGYFLFPGGTRISIGEFITVVAVVIFYIIMGLFYSFFKIGQQMRATAEKALLAAQRGMKIYLIFGIAWGIGFASAGLAAFLLGINYTVSLQMAHIAISAFVVALVGGLDSLWGTIPAGLIIALTERLTLTYVNPRLAETIPFIILLLVLLFKPWGFFGTEEELERV